MDQIISEIITKGVSFLNITLPPEAALMFESYFDYLTRRRKDFNLTAIYGAEDVARLHFLDSIALLNVVRRYAIINAPSSGLSDDPVHLKSAQFNEATVLSQVHLHNTTHSSAAMNVMRMIDIGSGAGFPGLPLKIAEPAIDLTLLEANGKRITFLSELCAALGVSAALVHARAEEAAHNFDMRELFDIVLSRAVARLDILCELCLPFARVGGVLLAMKGIDSDEEIAAARNAMATLGAEYADSNDYTIPDTDITHRAVVIRKTAPTPDAYPRRFARISKNPL